MLRTGLSNRADRSEANGILHRNRRLNRRKSLKIGLAHSLQVETYPEIRSNPKMNMKTTPTLIAAIVLGLVLTACDSKQENAREEALESKADALEEMADKTREGAEAAAESTQTAADAIREIGEKRADQLEDTADKARERQ